jgi:R3H domain
MNASVDDVREFVAETPEAALALAESFFRTSAAELETWVVPPSVQISGLGARVLMLAAPRSAAQSARPAPHREEGRERGGRGGERRDERRDDRRPRERDRERSAGPREEGRERGGRGGRERGDRGERGERDRGDRVERPREDAPAPVAAAPAEPLTPGRLGPVGDFVTGILERMKVRDVVASEAETDDGEIVVTVGGRGITALVEREPRLVAALSHLAHRAAEALVEGDDAAAQVVVHGARPAPREEGRERGGRGGRERGGRDSRGGGGGGGDRGGDRRPRRDPEDRDIDEGELERLAQDSARIARETGESQLLPPMNSRERWFVHNALKDERGVRSESEGDGARKRVRIFPA